MRVVETAGEAEATGGLDRGGGFAFDQRRAIDQDVRGLGGELRDHLGQRLFEVVKRTGDKQQADAVRFLPVAGKVQGGCAALAGDLFTGGHVGWKVLHDPAKAGRQVEIARVTVEKVAGVAAEIEDAG